ncbi:MAG: MFS transporter [Bacteroidota bacterium]
MKRKNLVKATLLFTSSLTVMAGAAIAPALPEITKAFASHPQATLLTKLILTMPALFIFLGAPLTGFVTDKLGRKPLLILSLVVYGLAGCSGLYLDGLVPVLVGRALLGLAVSGIMTVSTTLIGDYFFGQERTKFLGLQAASMAIGGMVYLSISGLLADVSWRVPFAIYLTSFLFLPFVWFFISEPSREKTAGATSEVKIQPLPRNTVWLIYATVLVNMVIFYLVPVQLPFYLKQLLGDTSNAMAGYAISTSTLFGAIASFSYQKIRARFSYHVIYALVFLFMGSGFLIIYGANQYAIVLAGLAIGGIGMGMLIPNSNLWIMSVTPEQYRGRVMSGLTGAVFLGQFLSPILAQPLISHYSYAIAFGVFGALMLVIALGFALTQGKVAAHATAS